MEHKIGDNLFISSAFYISRGSDDVAGGLATIKRFEYNKFLPKDHYNYCMVEFEEHPGRLLNYKYVIENQDDWAKEYEGKIAHSCPDIDTPWIQKGDIVNGKEWEGDDIW